MTKILLTLTIIHDHPRVLLGMKKRGFGEGKWNGFGGKVREHETVEAAAKRELSEEAGIQAEYLEKVGCVNFETKGDADIHEVHIFRTESFFGEPRESEEMRPEWFYIDEIPFKHMWPDDIHWMPLFLSGRKFTGRFLFGPENTILEKEINVVKKV